MNHPKSHLFYQSRLRRPLVDRAEGIYFWDSSGKRYLDGSSGAMVCNIGHSNPHVLEAMRKQMERATFAYRLQFENEPAEKLAAHLVEYMPQGMDKVFFVSGGSEAVEACLKMARQYTLAIGQPQRYKTISRFPSYHGSTLGALAATGMSLMSAPFDPMLRQMPKISAPTVYLDRDECTTEEKYNLRGLYYANLLEEEILRQGPETVLSFIMEPIGGASTGALVAPDSYYGRIREICDRYGVLLIYDEVMSGAGRTGRHYLGGAHWNAEPDLIALSKGMAAGYSPLGAMVTSGKMVEPVLDSGGFVHGYTYAGNPLSCSAGLAVLEEIEKQNLLAKAERTGDLLKSRLEDLLQRFSFIGDVRGKGLLLAVEFVSDRETMQPLPPEMNAHTEVVDMAFERGLIIYSRRTRGGRIGDHFLICPPLIIEEAQIDELLEMFTDTLVEFAQKHKLSCNSEE
jgi:adenosylmethionine-8-amino-7-oxononanoate aminotransferase